MAKKSNPIKASKRPTSSETNRNSPWIEDYRDFFSLKMQPVTEAFIERLSQDLIDWSKKEDSLIIGDFFSEKHLGRQTFYRWANKYPILKESHEFCMLRISARREKGGLTRKFDPNFVFNSMPMYDPTWKEFMQWKANLKQDEGNQQKIVVEINDLSSKVKE